MPADTMLCGTLSVNDTIPDVACDRVYIGAPTLNTNGARVNEDDVLFGSAGVMTDHISPNGSRDGVIHVKRSGLLEFQFLNEADKLEYRIET